jgi:3-hydroxyisobutyrate dehydrogenase
MARTRIAFLGLGIMGGGMARRLLDAGHELVVHNRTPSRAADLVAAGAVLAPTPRAAAQGAAVVISMVADDDASRAVWLGPEGALAGMAPAAIAVECSTLTVEWVKELAATARVELLDAPVTGSKKAAAAGELNFLVGGSNPAFSRVQPLLAAMGRSVTHLGPTGSGALIKLINNFLCGVQVASLAEAIAWIEKSGLDRTQAVAVLTEGSPGSPLVKMLAARMTAADYTPNFKLALMAKDLRYARATAAQSQVDLGSATQALTAFDAAIKRGDGERDMASVVERLRSREG